MAHRSFFCLTMPIPPPRAENPIDELDEEEFETFYAEASPLYDALCETLCAYTESHHTSIMGSLMAGDLLWSMLQQEYDIHMADA